MPRPEKPVGICSTESARWQPLTLQPGKPAAAGLATTGELFQEWRGFGGCFNELGWRALAALDKSKRAAVLADLFDPRRSCRFTYCRMPIGASDYARSWYSLNERGGDFAMKRFTIERDRGGLIPYIKAAMAFQKKLNLFASPWSPPTWMKNPPVYNGGRFIREKKYLEAYALYFARFVEAYRGEGIAVSDVHVQNEPVADQKFPSCVWTGGEMRDFIRDHLGPLFARKKLHTGIWLGTLNTDDYDGFPNTALSDPACRRFIAGVSFQWAGKHAIGRTHQAWPGVPLIQSENECGDGENTWDYALYVFDLMRHYISNGASAYVYWNMVLEPKGTSTWGWNQNSMITVDTRKGSARFNPEYYVMKHAARFVAPGARRLALTGPWSGNAFAFVNPDGSEVYCVDNPFPERRELTLRTASGACRAALAPRSVNTLIL